MDARIYAAAPLALANQLPLSTLSVLGLPCKKHYIRTRPLPLSHTDQQLNICLMSKSTRLAVCLLILRGTANSCRMSVSLDVKPVTYWTSCYFIHRLLTEGTLFVYTDFLTLAALYFKKYYIIYLLYYVICAISPTNLAVYH